MSSGCGSDSETMSGIGFWVKASFLEPSSDEVHEAISGEEALVVKVEERTRVVTSNGGVGEDRVYRAEARTRSAKKDSVS